MAITDFERRYPGWRFSPYTFTAYGMFGNLIGHKYTVIATNGVHHVALTTDQIDDAASAALCEMLDACENASPSETEN